MTSYDFIFSNNPGPKASRHFAFWIVLIFHFIIQNLMIGGVNEGLKSRGFADSAFNALFFFPVYILFVYVLIESVLPLFLFRRKYILSFVLFVGILFTNFLLCYFSGAFYLEIVQHLSFEQITFDINEYNVVVNGLFVPVAIYGVACGIKLSKKWYSEQKETERLVREKISWELQLLKTQLHPRFLFHSLHTIKEHIRSSSPFSAGLILQFSDLLSYILYESDKKYQLIETEIKMIRSYVDLEQKSIGGPLTTEINISGDGERKYISPLLLLSFIEVSFDCYLIDHPKDPSLKLSISIWDDHLDYHLICNRFFDKRNDPVEIKRKFIRLEKQLNILYPANHHIEIISNSCDITVVLNIPVASKMNRDIVFQNEAYELL
jgi:Histidine kinase